MPPKKVFKTLEGQRKLCFLDSNWRLIESGLGPTTFSQMSPRDSLQKFVTKSLSFTLSFRHSAYLHQPFVGYVVYVPLCKYMIKNPHSSLLIFLAAVTFYVYWSSWSKFKLCGSNSYSCLIAQWSDSVKGKITYYVLINQAGGLYGRIFCPRSLYRPKHFAEVCTKTEGIIPSIQTNQARLISILINGYIYNGNRN